MPDATKVAEWIKAEAGNGASIESGNHIWNPNWADFINEQIEIKKIKVVDTSISHPRTVTLFELLIKNINIVP